MINGIHLVETLVFSGGIAALFAAFVLACMESRHSVGIDEARDRLSFRLVSINTTRLTGLLVLSLRWLRDGIQSLVSELMTGLDRSQFAASIVISVLSVILPAAAIANAVLGGSVFLLAVYLCAAVSIVFLALIERDPTYRFVSGFLSVLVTLTWMVFAPFYAVHSLTDHLLNGTFSHSVLASIFVAVLFYAGCAGLWLVYCAFRQVRTTTTQLDRTVARFLFAAPLVYMIYWGGLLAGHFSTFAPSPPREWGALIAVVVLGSASFAAIVTIIDVGVVENRKGHGLAVFLGGLVVAMVGTIAINGLVTHEFPFWVRVWGADFSIQEVTLDGLFWISHAPFFLWGIMVLSTVGVFLAKVVIQCWHMVSDGFIQRPFIATSLVCLLAGTLLIGTGAAIDVYVNVN